MPQLSGYKKRRDHILNPLTLSCVYRYFRYIVDFLEASALIALTLKATKSSFNLAFHFAINLAKHPVATTCHRLNLPFRCCLCASLNKHFKVYN